MISFELDEDDQLVLDNVRKFAEDRLWGRLRDHERNREVAAATVTEAHELGLRTLTVPEAAGGGGLGRVQAVLVEEALAYGDPAACFALGGPGTLEAFVVELGDADQQKRILRRFTAPDAAGRRGAVAFTEATPRDGGGMSTTARQDGDGFVLSGQKSAVIDGGLADRIVVIAQVDDDAGWGGLGAFVVDGDAAGVVAGERRRTVGLDAMHVADVRLDDVRVPATARLTGDGAFAPALLRAFARVSLLQAARAVGCANRAFDLARSYVTERKAFGKPIGHFQAVAFTIADRLMDVEAARWLTWKAAADWDRDGEPELSAVAGACAAAYEAALRCGDDGVQLFGGAGFIRDYPIEKLFRDARQLSLVGASVEALDQIVAERAIGGWPDLSALLPTHDVQPVLL